ncbi:TrbI/VirB10 family protein [Calothrix sp. CCY 0018]|uniref:TrbI/VirB10 family protein n=1 Tax=Calothrix sp. CCY 0018 TaxID=3103864 RepID=UPI0039C743C6
MNENLNDENVVKEENQESETSWNEESLAKLLGYDYSDNQNNTVEETDIETISSIDEPIGNNEQEENGTEVQSTNKNVVDTHELFDSPHDSKTQPTFATNPFAKFGAVGLMLLVVFGTGATFLNTIISGKPRTAPKLTASKSEKPKVLFKEDTKPAEVENGKLKASLALSTQAEKIKSQEELKNTKTPIPKTDSQIPRKLNKENTNIQRKNIAPVERPPVITPVTSRTPVYRTVPRPTIRQNNYPTPVDYPPSRALPPSPPSTVIKPNSTPIPSPVRRVSPPPIPEKPPDVIDPMKQWVATNQLGSYGSAEIAINTLTKNEQRSSEQTEVAVSEEDLKPKKMPLSVPLMVSNRTVETAIHPEPLYAEEARILNEGRSISVETVGVLKVGSTIQGKLLTPLIWDKDSTNNANPKQSKFDRKENFIIQTTEPLKDSNGFITLPKNTQIVVTIKDIQESGLVQLQAAQILINGKQYILPQQAISIRGNSGKPLIASKQGNKGEDIAARDAETFVVGSLSKVGKVLNQPKSEQFSTSGGFGGNSSFSSIRRGNSNILGAVLEGGFEPLTEQIKERNKRKSSEVERRKKVWYVPANRDVQIFVNQSFTFSER